MGFNSSSFLGQNFSHSASAASTLPDPHEALPTPTLDTMHWSHERSQSRHFGTAILAPNQPPAGNAGAVSSWSPPTLPAVMVQKKGKMEFPWTHFFLIEYCFLFEKDDRARGKVAMNAFMVTIEPFIWLWIYFKIIYIYILHIYFSCIYLNIYWSVYVYIYILYLYIYSWNISVSPHGILVICCLAAGRLCSCRT